MSPPEKAEAILDALVVALRADVAAARARVQECTVELAGHAGPPPPAAMAFVALAIDRAYTAIEAAFLRIARTIDESVPGGESWHASLVHQMTLAIADRRVALIGTDIAAQLEPLRRHRHWLRHSYASTFDWSRMGAVAATTPAAIESACVALEAFAASLSA